MCPGMILSLIVLVTYNMKYELNRGEMDVIDKIWSIG